MNPPAFLDTSAIFALAFSQDVNHSFILDIDSDPGRAFFLHELIQVEAFSLTSKRHNKSLAVQVVKALRPFRKDRKVPLTPDLLEPDWQCCLRYADKEWDWIDCVSFELMDRRGICQALSLDRHFAQAGFTLLAS